MNVNILKTNNPYVSNTNKINRINDVKKVQLETEIKSPGGNSNKINANKIVTNSERQYFAKLFPESKTQIERHTLFNNSYNTKGKIVETNVAKGNMFDAKV